MNSTEKLTELLAKKSKIMEGGEGKIRSGALTARQRILSLFDDGSFIELGAFVQARDAQTSADGVVTGYGTVDGRLVYAYAQDMSVLSGAVGEMHADKICKIFELAAKMGAPIVGMLDSDGARLNEGTRSQAAMGKILSSVASVSGIVPNVSIVFGNCAGGSAIAATMSDFVIMNEESGRLFVNGPMVTEATTGEKAPSDANANNESGNAHLIGKDDAECIGIAKLLLTYLPSNNLTDAFEFETADDLNRATDSLASADEISDVRVIVSEIADDKAYFELQSTYASEITTGFIRLNGSCVGVVAASGEEMTANACGKAARFVRYCDCYNIPVLTITDVDGFKVSAKEECYGLARKSAELMYAFTTATTAKVNLIVKKAYGTMGVIMNSKQSGADIVLAYPTAEIAPLDAQAGTVMLYEDKLKAGENRDALIEQYKENEASVYAAAENGYVDDIIDPRESRSRVIGAFEMLRSKRASAANRKHDNIPL